MYTCVFSLICNRMLSIIDTVYDSYGICIDAEYKNILYL